MSDPVSSADVVFDFDAANTLITKCRSAATQVTDLSADRAPDVTTAKRDAATAAHLDVDALGRPTARGVAAPG